MVFQYKPGRSAATAPKPAALKQADLELYPGVNADPFKVATTHDPALRASWLADAGIWVDQHIEELASLACRARRLSDKLLCPSLADDPHRPAAMRRSMALDDEVIDTARGIVIDEARADRVWQSLSPEERESTMADFWWGTPSIDERLIGRAWTVMGSRYPWPVAFRIDRQWLAGLPLTVVMDLRIFKVLEWCPNPRPPMFDDAKNELIPMDIARQIADAHGNPL
jgi:hypothetical protein